MAVAHERRECVPTASSVAARHHQLPLDLSRSEGHSREGKPAEWEPARSASQASDGGTSSGHLLYERGSLKVLNGLLAELRLDVVGPEPLDHVDVAGRVPEGLRGSANPVFNR